MQIKKIIRAERKVTVKRGQYIILKEFEWNKCSLLECYNSELEIQIEL